jgi:hypothetical protein
MRIALLSATGALLLPMAAYAYAQEVPPPPDAGVPTNDAVGAPVPPESAPAPGGVDTTAPADPANSANPADTEAAKPSAGDATPRGKHKPRQGSGAGPSY